MIKTTATPSDDSTPLKAIRKYWLWFCNGSAHEVRHAPEDKDDLTYPLRFGKSVKGISSLKAIRAKCLDCCAGSPSRVRNCSKTDCALWPYRTGHNPRRSGIGGSFPKKPTHVPSD